MCRISRDADNREKTAPNSESLSQRILSRPVAPRRSRIHDEYPRGLFIVIRRKLASFQNGYMKGLEIPRGHFGVVHLQRFMGCGTYPSGYASSPLWPRVIGIQSVRDATFTPGNADTRSSIL